MSKRIQSKGFLPVPLIANRDELNAPLIIIIINALKGVKLQMNNLIPYDYLLNQAIRQYIIPDENWHLSKAAKELWDSITSEDIRKYNYKQPITCDRAEQTPAKKFVGNNSTGSDIKIKRGDRIPFNKLFSAEHMTPVSDIIKELKALNDITPENVKAILDKIHVCRVTKEEDRKINIKYGRGIDIESIKNDAYKNIPLVY
jgi:hypothetical protein